MIMRLRHFGIIYYLPSFTNGLQNLVQNCFLINLRIYSIDILEIFLVRLLFKQE